MEQNNYSGDYEGGYEGDYGHYDQRYNNDVQQGNEFHSNDNGSSRRSDRSSRDFKDRTDQRDKKDKYESRKVGRGRDRSRSTDRRRSRSRSSSRSRKSKKHKRKSRHSRKSSSDSRSRSSSRSRRRRRSRSYDSYESDDSRNYYSDYHDRDRDRGSDSYKHQEPNSTIMVRGMAPHLTEQDIRADLLKCGMGVKDVRLIRNRETGASRGFAFVEFHTVQDAIRWMDLKKGSISFHDDFFANLIYSLPKGPMVEKSKAVLNDWFCTQCQAHNFKRRDTCYKCKQPRPEDQDPELAEEISPFPTTTVLLYNLDALTTEESVLQAFKSDIVLASIPIKTVKIARDAATSVSRGCCYVYANNIADSVSLHTYLTKKTLDIDSRQAWVAFAKPAGQSSSSNAVAAAALAAAQWTNSSKTISSEEDIERMAQYSASLYAKTEDENRSYLAYYRDYFTKNPAEVNLGSIPAGTDFVNTKHHASFSVASSGPSAVSSRVINQRPMAGGAHAPDPVRYQYDEASGYYYDPLTGFYYDASTQYFYDSSKQQYLYWNAESNQYLPAAEGAQRSSESKEKKSDDRKPEKHDKVKVAKKIAKDMEKWAKTLNQKKESYSKSPFEMQSPPVGQAVASPATELPNREIGLIREMHGVKKGEGLLQLGSNKLLLPTAIPNLDDTDSGDEREPSVSSKVLEPDAFLDLTKMACLLCKRQFPNEEVLTKHTKMSDLHKKNLEALHSSSSTNPVKYRDRAQERRSTIGSDPLERKSTLKDMYMKAKKNATTSQVEQPTKDGIKADNIGNRMLQKMGWQEGQGLGRENQGRTEIIQAERRAQGTGLGHKSFPVVEDEGDRYSKARKITMARYRELD